MYATSTWTASGRVITTLGRGEPAVFIAGAGWTGYFNANLWDVNIECLSRQFRVIALDKLGAGLTSP